MTRPPLSEFFWIRPFDFNVFLIIKQAFDVRTVPFFLSFESWLVNSKLQVRLPYARKTDSNVEPRNCAFSWGVSGLDSRRFSCSVAFSAMRRVFLFLTRDETLPTKPCPLTPFHCMVKVWFAIMNIELTWLLHLLLPVAGLTHGGKASSLRFHSWSFFKTAPLFQQPCSLPEHSLTSSGRRPLTLKARTLMRQ